MKSYEQIASAFYRLHCHVLSSFISAATARLATPGSDLSPILIKASRPGIGIQATVRDSQHLLQATLVDLRVAEYVEANPAFDSPADDVIDFLGKLRRTRRLLLLADWQDNAEVAASILQGLMKARRPDDLIVIAAIGGEDDDIEEEVGRALGNEMWREITVITAEAPDILDDEAMQRLPATSN